MQTPTDSAAFDPPVWRSFWVIAAAITLFRIFVLMFSPSDLGPDEAQYWFWSHDLAYGYFSKPPLIAWAIALTTSIFGNAEWAVRLSAPLFHLGTAFFLYFTAQSLFDKRIAFWTGIGWLTIPGAILSSFIIATDAPLLFFWSGALFFVARIINADGNAAINFARLGAMIGLGLMAKYAMIYFIVALGISLVFQPLRKSLLRPELLLTALVAAIIFAPNIIWNLQHDFQTLSHTAANANWGASLFKPVSLAAFLGGQFVVFGLVPFGALAYAAFRFVRGKKHDRTMLLLFIFAVTPLLIVASQAFISRAHANWAAAAYPAATILVTAFLFRRDAGWLAKTSIAVHSFAFLVFSVGVVNLGVVDQLGLSGAVKDIRGWEDQTTAILGQGDGYDAIVIDDRYLISEMLYYQRDADIDIVAIDPNANTDNHFEAFVAFDPDRHKKVLFVTTRDDAAHVDYRFRSIEPVGAVRAEIGEGQSRRYTLFALGGYHPPGAK